MNTKQKNSELDRFKIFYEHTDDSRVVRNKQQRVLKRPKRSTASRRQ